MLGVRENTLSLSKRAFGGRVWLPKKIVCKTISLVFPKVSFRTMTHNELPIAPTAFASKQTSSSFRNSFGTPNVFRTYHGRAPSLALAAAIWSHCRLTKLVRNKKLNKTAIDFCWSAVAGPFYIIIEFLQPNWLLFILVNIRVAFLLNTRRALRMQLSFGCFAIAFDITKTLALRSRRPEDRPGYLSFPPFRCNLQALLRTLQCAKQPLLEHSSRTFFLILLFILICSMGDRFQCGKSTLFLSVSAHSKARRASLQWTSMLRTYFD